MKLIMNNYKNRKAFEVFRILKTYGMRIQINRIFVANLFQNCIIIKINISFKFINKKSFLILVSFIV